MSGLVLSLFPGIGLLDMAFEEAGFCVVRGPDVLWGGDVRRFHPPPDRFDGVIGGPPCQTFSSLANLVRARGYEPRFGNLIPEFERCIAEARPRWFLMENVRQAPEAAIAGYAVKSFLLANEELGEEQERQRRFSFGVRGAAEAPNLRRWIQPAALMLPARSRTMTQFPTDNSDKAKGEAARYRQRAVTSSDGGRNHGRVRLPEAIRLQGLPPDFLADSPLTNQGKMKAVANGVPLPMGRAVAAAVLAALVRLDAQRSATDPLRWAVQ